MPLRARVRCLLFMSLMTASACGHSEPFQDPGETNEGPFDPAVPIQLTYNPGADLTPAFLPGDSVVLYSYEQSGALNPNTCIGALPLAGGTRINDSCPRSAAALDSTERYENPVPLNDSLIVLVQAFREKGEGFDELSMLGTAPWRAADQLVPRLAFPFASASGVFEVSASYLAPLGASELAYLALVDLSACPGTEAFCPQPSLIRVGREIARLDMQATGDPSIAAGTEYATSAATGRTAGAFLFTLPFDTRIYERGADGSTVTLFDFGGDGIARDPMLAGNQLVAIVGGTVSQWTSGEGVSLQVDGGGSIMLVNLASGTVQRVTDPLTRYTRPALSADGRTIVAEGDGNLFRFDLP